MSSGEMIRKLHEQVLTLVTMVEEHQEDIKQLKQRLTTVESQGKNQTPNDAERYWTTDGKGPVGP